MNEKQYRQVCEACDSVLLSPNANIETTAIPWLHVIREHPFILEQYKNLFDQPTPLNTIKKYFKDQKNILGWLRNLYRALISRGQLWKTSRPLIDEVDVLFVSHLLNNEDAGKEIDFYFGNLPELIEADGRRVVVALINHSSHPNTSNVERWDSSMSTRVLLSPTLDFKDEWSLYRRLKCEAARLAKFARKIKPGLLQRAYYSASLEAMSGGARSALRISEQVGRLVASIKPKMMIVTYEGHAWERVVFSVAREAYPVIKCVGYQHAPIFRLQHSALRMLGSLFNPDIVMASGLLSKRQLEASLAPQGISISLLGSHRSSLQNMEGKFKDFSKDCNKKIYQADTSSLVCLVLPEGILSECLILIEFCLNCAESMPNVQFLLRLHPLMSEKGLIEVIPRLRIPPPNIMFSQSTLENDISRACIALYRGSTAIVKAICSGVQPVYLARQDELTIDPLYNLDKIRPSVATPAEFKSFFQFHKQKAALKNSNYNNCEILRYCEEFYSPFNIEAVLFGLR